MRLPDWLIDIIFWITEVPLWAWAWGAILLIYLVGISDPHCCITGPVDDSVGGSRW